VWSRLNFSTYVGRQMLFHLQPEQHISSITLSAWHTALCHPSCFSSCTLLLASVVKILGSVLKSLHTTTTSVQQAVWNSKVFAPALVTILCRR